MPAARRLTDADVGRRVVVRHRLADGDATDVLGILTAHDDTTLTVRDRHGADHTVDQAAVVAAKPIPPAPPRR